MFRSRGFPLLRPTADTAQLLLSFEKRVSSFISVTSGFLICFLLPFRSRRFPLPGRTANIPALRFSFEVWEDGKAENFLFAAFLTILE